MVRKTAILAAALGLVFAAPVLAHTALVSSAPKANATVAKVSKVELTFNEKVMPQFSGAELTMTTMPGMAMHDPMKMAVAASKVSPDGKTLTLTTQRALPAGTYKVAWHAAGADTHRMTGDFAFTVK